VADGSGPLEILLTYRKLVSSFFLVAIVLAACAPEAVVTETPPPVFSAVPVAKGTQLPASQTPGLPPLPVATPSSTAGPLPIVTSRGDKLEASDPETVSLASGGPQLVEFFAFW